MFSYIQFSKQKEYLPNFVFGYYSGPTNRLEEHYEKHQERFYQDLIKGKDRPLRPLFYARCVLHAKTSLYSYWMSQTHT